jgi:hypothetical protein
MQYLKNKRGAPAAFLGSSISKHPAKSAMPPGKLFAHLSNIGQLWGFAAHNMQPSTARTSEIARYARLGQAVSLLSPLLSFRAFHRDIRYQLNQIEEPLHRLRDFERVSLFSAVFLGVCIFLSRARTSRLLVLLLPALCFVGPADPGGAGHVSSLDLHLHYAD